MKKRKKLIVIIVLVVIGVAVFLFLNKSNTIYLDTLNIETYENKTYYIIKDDYSGEYDLQFIDLSEYYHQYDEAEDFEKKEVMNYNEYKAYCDEWGLKKEYSDVSKNYIVFSYMSKFSTSIEARLAAVDYNDNNVDLYIWDDPYGVAASISAYSIIIPTEKEINDINVVAVYTDEEFENIKKYGTTYDSPYVSVDKPIIYLYPTEETEISVKLLNADKITCSYPKYIDGWKVLAKPNGDLIDLDTNRNLYALYYESLNVENFDVSQEGFVVKGEDSAKFLEDKLEILGLTEREIEEFIIYWLPKLESNKYNYIRFATIDEINNNMPIEIDPTPDTIIRVLMIFKKLDNPIDVKEQELTTIERKGFVVVEWGGTEIKDVK